jgi:hypothetical protein
MNRVSFAWSRLTEWHASISQPKLEAYLHQRLASLQPRTRIDKTPRFPTLSALVVFTSSLPSGTLLVFFVLSHSCASTDISTHRGEDTASVFPSDTTHPYGRAWATVPLLPHCCPLTGHSHFIITHPHSDNDKYESNAGGPRTGETRAAAKRWDLFGTKLSLQPQNNTQPSCQLDQPIFPTPSNLYFPLPAQAAAFTYTPQDSFFFGDRTVTTGEEEEFFVLPHHRQDLATSEYEHEFADYTNLTLPDFGDLTMPLLAPQQLETTTWSPYYMESTVSVPSLNDSDNSLSSPASLGSTTDNSSLDRSDASSPWELGAAWDPPLYMQSFCETRPSS